MGFATFSLRLVPFGFRDRIRQVPGLAFLQRKIISLTLDGREFNHCVDAGPAKGITFPVCFPDDKGIWTGTYELGFATRLAQQVQPGMVTYDIGSWHGFFAGVMAAQGASEVHVFEPLPTNAERIRRLIGLNPSKPIKLHDWAIGDADTEMDLMIMPQTSMAKLEASSFQAGAPNSGRVRVKVRSIDSVVNAGEAPPPDLMKIDVEGAELMVLAGALGTIRRQQTIIFAEVHSPALLSECKAFFDGVGYRVEVLGDGAQHAKEQQVVQIIAKPPAHGSPGTVFRRG